MYLKSKPKSFRLHTISDRENSLIANVKFLSEKFYWTNFYVSMLFL